ncbi:hypothetical protein I350_00597 [Cryptococcus amylolentus CBS 6273]|uniref:Uncharacterized protein n=1 Tax=Cryptococcus amylolentus CBS 6273 TaxID=1296118 RepID=A0A1E3KFY6_9TREE|nr:hypothetical protein I350_00597 [Cryptococcus amylolentus CBS 6273]
MLDLFLVPKHGNAGGRNFPHAGHLGVSPVVVQGKIITKRPSVVPEPFLVRSVSLRVKCTEFRAGGAFEGELQNTLYEQTQTILVPPEGDEYISLGDWESPFRIIIPTDAAVQGRSSMTIREYKVVWRMEAVLEHKTIPYVGNGFTKAYALELQNYQSPPLMPLSPPSPLFIGSDTLCSWVSINVPHGAFGPGDSFNVAVRVRPENPAVLVKKVSVIFERLIERVDPKSADGRRESFNGHSPSKRRHTQSPRAHSPTQTTSKLSSIIRRSLSPRPPFHRLPTDPVAREPESPAAEGHVIRDKILETASTGMEQGSNGAGICTLAVNLPRRAGTWALGETHRSGLVAMTYQLKVSVTLKGDRRASASKSFTCPPIPIVISSTSSAERSKAVMQAETRRRKLAGGKNGLYLHEANSSVFNTPESFHRSEEVLSPITGVATNVKPILLSDKSSPAPSSQSISFIFPSPPPQDSPPKSHLPIQSLLNPESSPPTPDNEQLLSPPPTRGTGAELDRTEFDPEYKSILNRFQAQASSGRRISATTSEEEEVQPLRSRQKLNPEESRGTSEFDYPSLPSLDALGLGLPHVPEDARPRLRRPNTAPIHSTFSMSRSEQVPLPLSGGLGKKSGVGGGRPVTSYGVLGRTQRGTGSAVFGRTRAEGGGADTFAFVMPREKSAGSDE